MKPSRDFKVGDIVRYELAAHPPEPLEPRWIHTDNGEFEDRGATEKFKHAKVMRVLVDSDGDTFAILKLSTGLEWLIPQPSNGQVIWDAGEYPYQFPDFVEEPKKKIVTSSSRILHYTCDCGKERSGAKAHYSWCSTQK